MSYDKYERGHEHLNGGHQRITYKKKKVNTYPKAYPKQSLGRVKHATQIHWLNPPLPK